MNRQHMSLFEALEMDRDKTLIELARVEYNYTGNVSSGPTKHSTTTFDVRSDCNSPYCDRLDSHSDLGDYGLIKSALSLIHI